MHINICSRDKSDGSYLKQNCCCCSWWIWILICFLLIGPFIKGHGHTKTMPHQPTEVGYTLPYSHCIGPGIVPTDDRGAESHNIVMLTSVLGKHLLCRQCCPGRHAPTQPSSTRTTGRGPAAHLVQGGDWMVVRRSTFCSISELLILDTDKQILY